MLSPASSVQAGWNPSSSAARVVSANVSRMSPFSAGCRRMSSVRPVMRSMSRKHLVHGDPAAAADVIDAPGPAPVAGRHGGRDDVVHVREIAGLLPVAEQLNRRRRSARPG